MVEILILSVMRNLTLVNPTPSNCTRTRTICDKNSVCSAKNLPDPLKFYTGVPVAPMTFSMSGLGRPKLGVRYMTYLRAFMEKNTLLMTSGLQLKCAVKVSKSWVQLLYIFLFPPSPTLLIAGSFLFESVEVRSVSPLLCANPDQRTQKLNIHNTL